MLSYVFALLAACANAGASVLQRRANKEVPQDANLRPKLIGQLLHSPVWFGGMLCMVGAFLLQAAALSHGQLAVVQPLLVTELPVTLVLASWVFHTPLHRREWLSIGGMTLGLVSVLYFLSPRGGTATSVAWEAWLVGILANLALVGALVLIGRSAPGGKRGAGRRAALFGIAAGCQFALTAALMKGAMSRTQQGIEQVFTSWQLYAMGASGLLAVFLLQSAVHAGKLLAAQPGLTLSDPLLAVVWGVFAFGETVRGGLMIAAALAGGAVLAVSVVLLTRSPLLHGESAVNEQGDQDQAAEAEPERGGG